MRRKRPLLIAGAILALSGVTLFVVFNLHLNLPVAPVDVRFLGIATSTNNLAARSGPTFWISNNTSKVLSIDPWAVELKEGTNWTKRDYRDFWGPVLLVPHGTISETIDFSSQLYPQPTNTWRLQLNVAERLFGLDAVVAPVAHYPGWLLQRYRTGDTNLSRANPLRFARGTWYGHARKVLSEEVRERYTLTSSR
jgi:hypothetical protein